MSQKSGKPEKAEITILQGDVVEQLKCLPDCSVQCCVTSPPYYGLRDYGVAGQIGMEETPELFVAKIVEVFREVKRVLRDDGTLWLNFGDSYSGSNSTKDAAINPDSLSYKSGQTKGGVSKCIGVVPGLKPKDLIGIPWMVAFALRSDGWYLRSDIIWSKPNPMPESVTDRPTKAHEYIFLLTKNSRYFYDADAVREEFVSEQKERVELRTFEQGMTGRNNGKCGPPKNLLRPDPHSMHMARNGTNIPGHSGNYNANGECVLNPLGRNRRTVWEIAPQPTPEAHFATFPEALVEPCIKAGSKIGDTILDPFGGSGTTAKVARDLKRRCILIELNPAYVKIMRNKLRLNEQLVF